jgi:membrane fusion protein, multidrug efflux system
MNMHTTTPIVRRLAPLRAALAVLALAVAASGCGRSGADQRRSAGPPPVPVSLGKAVRKDMLVTLRAIGQVEAMANVAVRSRVSGELQKVHFEEGQAVKVGQLLFTVDPRPARAALAQAEAQLARDQAQLTQAEADVTRYARLVEEDFITKQQYDQARTLVATSKAAIAADVALAENARLQVEYSAITAPVSGRTGNLQVKPGNLVQAGDGKVLVTINQTKPIYASFAVPAQYLPAILARRGARRPVSALPAQSAGAPADGVLTFVDNAVDTSTNTVLLKATFANEEEQLWPGQFVDVNLTVDQEPNRVVVPAPAVQTGQQGNYLYVVRADQSVEMRPVTLVRLNDVEAVIGSGLEGGETVVTDGQLRLTPGTKIVAKPAVGTVERGAGKAS